MSTASTIPGTDEEARANALRGLQESREADARAALGGRSNSFAVFTSDSVPIVLTPPDKIRRNNTPAVPLGCTDLSHDKVPALLPRGVQLTVSAMMMMRRRSARKTRKRKKTRKTRRTRRTRSTDMMTQVWMKGELLLNMATALSQTHNLKHHTQSQKHLHRLRLAMQQRPLLQDQHPLFLSALLTARNQRNSPPRRVLVLMVINYINKIALGHASQTPSLQPRVCQVQYRRHQHLSHQQLMH